uniref:Akt1s1 protein n=1 Tax=Fopius arisanus TaxID=64838 RepID=A0A0C9RG43_9HYME
MVMSSDEIEKLKTSPNYSSIFRVVIDHGLDDGDLLEAPTKYSVSQLSSNLQLALTNLQQQLEQVVHRKAAETEEKIRTLTAEQHQLLEQFREQAHTEHRLLARIICDQQKNKSTNGVNSNVPMTENPAANSITSPLKFNSPRSNVLSKSGMGGDNIRHQAATKHPTQIHLNGDAEGKDRRLRAFQTESSSYDAEALFPLEGMDDVSYTEPLHPSEDESDTDGQEEGMHTPRGLRGGHPTLAKSLPVSVPNFSSYVRRTMQDQDDDQIPKDSFDPHNIRASIKALAKSVHGDTVFGDLPRPRFSTQI